MATDYNGFSPKNLIFAIISLDILIFQPIMTRGSILLAEGTQSDVCSDRTEAEQPASLDSLREVLQDEAYDRLLQLGKVSDVEGSLQRTFLSPAGLRAARILDRWMQEAGLRTWMDGVGNVHGRVDGLNPLAPAILLGSHLDTVLDAGKFDGALGIICAIAAIKALLLEGGAKRLQRPVEVIAFSDEEGVRFQSTFLGSTAITGKFPSDMLHATDRSGITLTSALNAIGLEGTRSGIASVKYDPKRVWGYVEVHIEQGPVLEAENAPLGIVPAIAGQTRLSVTISGAQGHAGTVPMRNRRDPMAAAAESMVGIERICTALGEPKGPTHKEADVSGLVCTVGEMRVWPGASNVIPGEVMFTLDVRARRDLIRNEAVKEIRTNVEEVCKRRQVTCLVDLKHEAIALECAPSVVDRLNRVARETVATLNPSGPRNLEEVRVPVVVSGAGHDAMAMGALTQVGMLFVRCKGGLSHTPEEDVDSHDVFMASAALLLFLREELI